MATESPGWTGRWVACPLQWIHQGNHLHSSNIFITFLFHFFMLSQFIFPTIFPPFLSIYFTLYHTHFIVAWFQRWYDLNLSYYFHSFILTMLLLADRRDAAYGWSGGPFNVRCLLLHWWLGDKISSQSPLYSCNNAISLILCRYAEMGNTIPTSSGKTPLLAPYWAKNQVLLFADNGRVCPLEFKQEMDDELLFLLHSANIDEENDSIVMRKLEACSSFLCLTNLLPLIRSFGFFPFFSPVLSSFAFPHSLYNNFAF